MERYFGTDGIRGVANRDLTPELAFRCGNAVARLRTRPRIVIGRDTRTSGEMFLMCVSGGAMAAGADVVDLGVIPTAGVAYLTRYLGADFGIVISASHNPDRFNGIKVFRADGRKMSEAEEAATERHFSATWLSEPHLIGRRSVRSDSLRIYEDWLCQTVSCSLSGFKVVLDCSNGASCMAAPEVFKRLGAEVVCIGNRPEAGINESCGSLHPENLQAEVVKQGADMGFAYDGDADRVIAVDERGALGDGDQILYLLARRRQVQGQLPGGCVVGTAHTNLGMEHALREQGIKLHRADIGDKYVMELMQKTGAAVGGEQSGHIILSAFATTGDGILTSLQVAECVRESGEKLSELLKVELYPQTNVSIEVKEKLRIMGNESLAESVEEQRNTLEGKGRIVVRASGTEPVIRVFAECRDAELAARCAGQVAERIREIDAMYEV